MVTFWCRTATLPALVASVLVAGDPGPSVPPELAAVVAVAQSFGYPDFSAATVVRTTVQITVPAEDFPALQGLTGSSDWSPDGPRRRQELRVRAVRLRDGGLRLRNGILRPRDGWTVSVGSEELVSPDQLTAMHFAPQPPAAWRERLSGWFAPEDRPRLAGTLGFSDGNAGADVTDTVALVGQDVIASTWISGRFDDRVWTSLAARTAFLLDGEALPPAPPLELGWGSGGGRLRPGLPVAWALSEVHHGGEPVAGPTPPADRHGRLRLPDAAGTARRVVGCWLVARIRTGDRRAIAGLHALFAAEPAAGPALAALAEPSPVAVDPAIEALATRLAGWDQGDGPTAWGPKPGDRAGLISLVGDPRPATWTGRGTRTIGDQALRAWSRLLGADPRWLIGMDPAEPWTPAARQRAAQALRSLADHDEAGLDRRLAEAMPPGRDLIEVLQRRPGQRRQVIAKALAARWAAARPDIAPEDLGRLLALIDGDPAVAAAVRAWPAEGAAAPLIAVARARLGDPAALDRLMAEAMRPLGPEEMLQAAARARALQDDPEADDDTTEAIRGRLSLPGELVTAAGPWLSEAAVAAVARWTEEHAEDPLAWSIRAAIAGRDTPSAALRGVLALHGNQGTQPPFTTGSLRPLLVAGLRDRRPARCTLPWRLVLGAQSRDGGLPAWGRSEPPHAPGVRICDLVAAGVGARLDRPITVDLTAPAATRDAQVAAVLATLPAVRPPPAPAALR